MKYEETSSFEWTSSQNQYNDLFQRFRLEKLSAEYRYFAKIPKYTSRRIDNEAEAINLCNQDRLQVCYPSPVYVARIRKKRGSCDGNGTLLLLIL